MEKIAVILVETYCAKLHIAACDQDNYFIMLAEEKEPIKLGLEMGDDHFLKKPQIDATIAVLKNFRKVCDVHGVTKTIAIANLFRDTKPKNIYSFFDEVYASCGFRFTVLPQEEQNNKVYLGTINSFDIPKGVAVHLTADALHIIEYNRRTIVNSETINLGPMTLLNMYDMDELGKEAALAKIQKYISTKLSDIEWLPKTDPEFSLVISGDYATDLAKMLRRYKKYPLDRDFGYVATREDIAFLKEQVFALDLGKNKKIKFIREPRVDVFASAVAIFDALIEVLDKKDAAIADNSFVRGILYSEVIPSTLEKPISDVLGYSVIAETSFHDPDSEKHNEQVYNLSMLLFKQLRVLHKLPRGYIKILRVASFMHDVGKRVNYITHAKNAYNVILGAEVFGVTHRELVIAAFVASLHQGGEIPLTEWVKYKDLLTEEDLMAANKLGVILRLAEAFDRTKNNVIVDITCDILGDSVIMKTFATGDSTYELDKALETGKEFERYFKKKLEIL